jgi:hypothetical protein
MTVPRQRPQISRFILLIRISASFSPTTVRVNTETVYSGRREAGVVMAPSPREMAEFQVVPHLADIIHEE